MIRKERVQKEDRLRIASEAVFYSQARHMQTHVSCVGSCGGHIKTAVQ